MSSRISNCHGATSGCWRNPRASRAREVLIDTSDFTRFTAERITLARDLATLPATRNSRFYKECSLWTSGICSSHSGSDRFCNRALERALGRRDNVWIEIVSEFEALASIAAYSFEHPDDPFPELVSEGAVYEGTVVAHPLLPRVRAVANDVSLTSTEPARAALVISGSNMSGKSTMLRTVGESTQYWRRQALLSELNACGFRVLP